MSKRKKHLHPAAIKLLQYSFVTLFWLTVWVIAAHAVGEALLLPSPFAVLKRLGELCLLPLFWKTVLTSLGRILYGVTLAILLGSILATATHFVPFLYTLFYPLITVIRTTPVASFIILAYLWIDRDTLPSFIAVLMVLPVVWANLHEALGAVDRDLLEMGKAYRFSPWKRFRRIYLPSVMPAFTASCRSSVGLAWKAGVAAEILIVPLVSIGKMLYESKLYLETTDLFAWTVTVILLSLLLELLLLSAVRVFNKRRRIRPKKTEVMHRG